jgi:hypothetical protein
MESDGTLIAIVVGTIGLILITANWREYSFNDTSGSRFMISYVAVGILGAASIAMGLIAFVSTDL